MARPRPGNLPVEEDWLAGEPRTDVQGLARLSMKSGNLHCSSRVATIEKALSRLDGGPEAMRGIGCLVPRVPKLR